MFDPKCSFKMNRWRTVLGHDIGVCLFIPGEWSLPADPELGRVFSQLSRPRRSNLGEWLAPPSTGSVLPIFPLSARKQTKPGLFSRANQPKLICLQTTPLINCDHNKIFTIGLNNLMLQKMITPKNNFLKYRWVINISVADPVHFFPDPDPDPRIRFFKYGSGSGSGWPKKGRIRPDPDPIPDPTQICFRCLAK